MKAKQTKKLFTLFHIKSKWKKNSLWQFLLIQLKARTYPFIHLQLIQTTFFSANSNVNAKCTSTYHKWRHDVEHYFRQYVLIHRETKFLFSFQLNISKYFKHNYRKYTFYIRPMKCKNINDTFEVRKNSTLLLLLLLLPSLSLFYAFEINLDTYNCHHKFQCARGKYENTTWADK